MLGQPQHLSKMGFRVCVAFVFSCLSLVDPRSLQPMRSLGQLMRGRIRPPAYRCRMAPGFPLHASSVLPKIAGTPEAARPRSAARSESLYYPIRRVSPFLVAICMALSAGLHLAVLFGVQKSKPTAARAADPDLIALTLSPPLIKELEEEPELLPNESRDAPLDLALPVPTQADLPSLPRPEDFVQAFDFSSLIEKPEMRDTKISVIPEHIQRGVDLRAKIGPIFNLADLDRPPEPVLQPAPVFPFNLKREAITGQVRVEFVVDTEGRVRNAFVIETTHPGFDEAALTGVSRWRFRPGYKNGRKVNTRMQVPILFRIVDGLE